MQPVEEHRRHNEPRCPFCRPWFGMALVGFWACAGVAFFSATHLLEEYHPKDFWFYLGIYSGIGASTGALSWYLARLVASHRLKLRGVVAVLLLPYLFILGLSLDKNPLICIVASVAFGFALWLACRVHSIVRQQDSTGQTYET